MVIPRCCYYGTVVNSLTFPFTLPFPVSCSHLRFTFPTVIHYTFVDYVDFTLVISFCDFVTRLPHYVRITIPSLITVTVVGYTFVIQSRSHLFVRCSTTTPHVHYRCYLPHMRFALISFVPEICCSVTFVVVTTSFCSTRFTLHVYDVPTIPTFRIC